MSLSRLAKCAEQRQFPWRRQSKAVSGLLILCYKAANLDKRSSHTGPAEPLSADWTRRFTSVLFAPLCCNFVGPGILNVYHVTEGHCVISESMIYLLRITCWAIRVAADPRLCTGRARVGGGRFLH